MSTSPVTANPNKNLHTKIGSQNAKAPSFNTFFYFEGEGRGQDVITNSRSKRLVNVRNSED